MTKDSSGLIPNSPVTTASSFDKDGSVILSESASSESPIRKKNEKLDECYGTPTSSNSNDDNDGYGEKIIINDNLFTPDENVMNSFLVLPDGAIANDNNKESIQLKQEKDCLEEVEVEIKDNHDQLRNNDEDETELEEAMAELSVAIKNNHHLTKTQKEFFESMAHDSNYVGYDNNYDDEPSIAGTCETMASLASIRKATLYLNEDNEDNKALDKKKLKKPLPRRPSSKRNSTVQMNLWQAHANRIAPSVVLNRVAAEETSASPGFKKVFSANDLQNIVTDLSTNGKDNNNTDINNQYSFDDVNQSSPTFRADAAIMIGDEGGYRNNLRDFTSNDIMTPKKSNKRNANDEDNNAKLAAQGGALSLGLAMPTFDSDDADNNDISFEYNNDDNSITDSLLTDDDGSLLGYFHNSEIEHDIDDDDDCMNNDNHDEEIPQTTTLFTSDRLSLDANNNSLFNNQNNNSHDNDDDNHSVTKLKPILRTGHYGKKEEVTTNEDNDETSINSCRRFSPPSIRDIGNGIEVIPHYDTPFIGYSYSYDTATTCDTKSTVISCMQQGRYQNHQRLFRLSSSNKNVTDDDNKSLISSSSIHTGSTISIDCNFSIPSIHRCYANDEESIKSICSSIRRTVSYPVPVGSQKYISYDNNKSLGDDITFVSNATTSFTERDLNGKDDDIDDGNRSVRFAERDQYDNDDAIDDDNKSVKFAKTSTILLQPHHNDDPLEFSLHSRKTHNISLLPSCRKQIFPTTNDDDDEQRNYNNDDDGYSISSWTIQTTATDDRIKYNNAWNVFNDEYCNNVELPFEIFGTSADDSSAMPHVLSPPLMDSLRNFLPDRLFHQNYWLKYSLVRDGADLQILQRKVKSSHNTILAIETTTGHVFGCFTTTAWRKNHSYFGNGESFVWKMKNNRSVDDNEDGTTSYSTSCYYSIVDQVKMESEIEVFGYSKQNDMIQTCRHDFIAIGGGGGISFINNSNNNKPSSSSSSQQDETNNQQSSPEEVEEEKEKDQQHMGFAIALDDDLLQGTTSPCATFYSPCLIDPKDKYGQVFEVVNLEVWTYTPCLSEEDAERNELRLMFAESNTTASYATSNNTDSDVLGTFIRAY